MHASSSTPDQTEAWVRQVLVLNFLNFLLTCPSAAPTLRQPDRCVRRVCARPAATHTHPHTHTPTHSTHTQLSVQGSPHPELPSSVYSSHTRSGTSSAARCWPDSPFLSFPAGLLSSDTYPHGAGHTVDLTRTSLVSVLYPELCAHLTRLSLLSWKMLVTC